MQASVLDLRYKMKEVLQALERRETVTVLYHGKTKGTIIPCEESKSAFGIKDHPFFGMNKKNKRSVSAIMDQLRGGRY